MAYAKSFSGSAIANAYATYKVKRQAYYTPYRFNNQADKNIIASGECLLDNKGRFSFNFIPYAENTINENARNNYFFSIEVEVTDLNGETRNAIKQLRIGNRSLYLDINIPLELERNSDNSFELSSVNANGDFIPVKGKIRFIKKSRNKNVYKKRNWPLPDQNIYNEKEWNKLICDIEFFNGETKKNNKNEPVFEIDFDTGNKKQILINELDSWTEAEYIVEIISTDKYGVEYKKEKEFVLFDKEKKSMPFAKPVWFASNNDIVQPGDVVDLVIGSALSNIKVLYEIENHGDIVYKVWLNISKEKQLLEIPVKEEYRGNFSIHLSTIINNRKYQFDKLFKVPFDNKKLDIMVSNFRDILYPGEKTQLKITIKNDLEIGVAAEFLTAMYDASLDNIKPFTWDFTVFQQNYMRALWHSNGFSLGRPFKYPVLGSNIPSNPLRIYKRLNWFGFSS